MAHTDLVLSRMQPQGQEPGQPVSTIVGMAAGVIVGVAIFVAPIAILVSSPGTPSQCTQYVNCDPSHDTLGATGAITHYGK